ncbi:hypothetical protein M404DRAFT_158905 [Pisolithus tinctorius Marx 270]|uniref:Uncharacterized protein n=1 Tax=Pisolithus tinctorius Marx 270 TaxID=870435 RepID=A0A0C3JK39_PISTI|nr:hypothetical protein M404DRAFT_158905 [Pisolithus tinctorius Marx 270]
MVENTDSKDDAAFSSTNSVDTKSPKSETYSAYMWLADSATTSHIYAHHEALLPTSQIGDQTVTANLHDVLHVLSLPNNLFSIGCLDAQGGCSISGEGQIELCNSSGDVIALGKQKNHLYELQFTIPTRSKQTSLANETTL